MNHSINHCPLKNRPLLTLSCWHSTSGGMSSGLVPIHHHSTNRPFGGGGRTGGKTTRSFGLLGSTVPTDGEGPPSRPTTDIQCTFSVSVSRVSRFGGLQGRQGYHGHCPRADGLGGLSLLSDWYLRSATSGTVHFTPALLPSPWTVNITWTCRQSLDFLKLKYLLPLWAYNIFQLRDRRTKSVSCG